MYALLVHSPPTPTISLRPCSNCLSSPPNFLEYNEYFSPFTGGGGGGGREGGMDDDDASVDELLRRLEGGRHGLPGRVAAAVAEELHTVEARCAGTAAHAASGRGVDAELEEARFRARDPSSLEHHRRQLRQVDRRLKGMSYTGACKDAPLPAWQIEVPEETRPAAPPPLRARSRRDLAGLMLDHLLPRGTPAPAWPESPRIDAAAAEAAYAARRARQAEHATVEATVTTTATIGSAHPLRTEGTAGAAGLPLPAPQPSQVQGVAPSAAQVAAGEGGLRGLVLTRLAEQGAGTEAARDVQQPAQAQPSQTPPVYHINVPPAPAAAPAQVAVTVDTSTTASVLKSQQTILETISGCLVRLADERASAPLAAAPPQPTPTPSPPARQAEDAAAAVAAAAAAAEVATAAAEETKTRRRRVALRGVRAMAQALERAVLARWYGVLLGHRAMARRLRAHRRKQGVAEALLLNTKLRCASRALHVLTAFAAGRQRKRRATRVSRHVLEVLRRTSELLLAKTYFGRLRAFRRPPSTLNRLRAGALASGQRGAGGVTGGVPVLKSLSHIPIHVPAKFCVVTDLPENPQAEPFSAADPVPLTYYASLSSGNRVLLGAAEPAAAAASGFAGGEQSGGVHVSRRRYDSEADRLLAEQMAAGGGEAADSEAAAGSPPLQGSTSATAFRPFRNVDAIEKRLAAREDALRNGVGGGGSGGGAGVSLSPRRAGAAAQSLLRLRDAEKVTQQVVEEVAQAVLTGVIRKEFLRCSDGGAARFDQRVEEAKKRRPGPSLVSAEVAAFLKTVRIDDAAEGGDREAAKQAAVERVAASLLTDRYTALLRPLLRVSSTSAAVAAAVAVGAISSAPSPLLSASERAGLGALAAADIESIVGRVLEQRQRAEEAARAPVARVCAEEAAARFAVGCERAEFEEFVGRIGVLRRECGERRSGLLVHYVVESERMYRGRILVAYGMVYDELRYSMLQTLLRTAVVASTAAGAVGGGGGAMPQLLLTASTDVPIARSPAATPLQLPLPPAGAGVLTPVSPSLSVASAHSSAVAWRASHPQQQHSRGAWQQQQQQQYHATPLLSSPQSPPSIGPSTEKAKAHAHLQWEAEQKAQQVAQVQQQQRVRFDLVNTERAAAPPHVAYETRVREEERRPHPAASRVRDEDEDAVVARGPPRRHLHARTPPPPGHYLQYSHGALSSAPALANFITDWFGGVRQEGMPQPPRQHQPPRSRRAAGAGEGWGQAGSQFSSDEPPSSEKSGQYYTYPEASTHEELRGKRALPESVRTYLTKVVRGVTGSGNDSSTTTSTGAPTSATSVTDLTGTATSSSTTTDTETSSTRTQPGGFLPPYNDGGYRSPSATTYASDEAAGGAADAGRAPLGSDGTSYS